MLPSSAQKNINDSNAATRYSVHLSASILLLHRMYNHCSEGKETRREHYASEAATSHILVLQIFKSKLVEFDPHGKTSNSLHSLYLPVIHVFTMRHFILAHVNIIVIYTYQTLWKLDNGPLHFSQSSRWVLGRRFSRRLTSYSCWHSLLVI